LELHTLPKLSHDHPGFAPDLLPHLELSSAIRAKLHIENGSAAGL
jgi:hypothetical protein